MPTTSTAKYVLPKSPVELRSGAIRAKTRDEISNEVQLQASRTELAKRISELAKQISESAHRLSKLEQQTEHVRNSLNNIGLALADQLNCSVASHTTSRWVVVG
jgi:septal ring factor EnvC (AmiA/AmiB activator)